MQEQKRALAECRIMWGKILLQLFLVVPQLLCEVYSASACRAWNEFQESEPGDADIHISVNECNVIRSQEVKEFPENIISPKH